LNGAGHETKSGNDKLRQRISKNESEAICNDDPKIRDVFVSVTRWMLALYLASNPTELVKLSFLAIFACYSDWAASQRDREKNEVYTRASGLPA